MMIPLEYVNLKWFIRTENKVVVDLLKRTKMDSACQNYYAGARYMLKQIAKRYAQDIIARRRYDKTELTTG